MASQYVSGQLIKSIHKAGKALAVESVNRTSAWIRPSDYPVASAAEEFVELVAEYAGTFKPDTVKVAMKYVL